MLEASEQDVCFVTQFTYKYEDHWAGRYILPTLVLVKNWGMIERIVKLCPEHDINAKSI